MAATACSLFNIMEPFWQQSWSNISMHSIISPSKKNIRLSNVFLPSSLEITLSLGKMNWVEIMRLAKLFNEAS